MIWRKEVTFVWTPIPRVGFAFDNVSIVGLKAHIFLLSFFHPLPRINKHFAKKIFIHIITSLSLSICGVCESHKFPIICPLWVLNELTSIVDKMQHDWKRTPYIHSFKIGARITFQSKSHVIIFWWLLCVSIFNPSLFQGKRWGHRELMG